MKGCKGWTCSVLPLLQSSQSCNADDVHRLCQMQKILSNIHISWTWWNYSRYNYEENTVLASSECWPVISDCLINVLQGCHREGRAKPSPLAADKINGKSLPAAPRGAGHCRAGEWSWWQVWRWTTEVGGSANEAGEGMLKELYLEIQAWVQATHFLMHTRFL